jgi:hypothetical protein
MSVLTNSNTQDEGAQEPMKALDLPTNMLIEVAQGFPDAPNLQRSIELELTKRRHEELSKKLDELKKPHWTVLPNFWLTAISALAAVLAAYLAWLALRK